MTRLRYRIVDVFTEQPLGGNPLCVVLDECEPSLMQSLAREVNLPETTFPVITGPDSYSMRIFTSSMEFPFAGHPSLGTAWALGPRRWTQVTSGATVVVEADEHGARMTQPTPTFVDFDQTAKIASAANVNEVSEAMFATVGGLTFLIGRTEQPLSMVQITEPVAGDLIHDTDAVGLAVCRVANADVIETRVFFPGDAVFEDPGTGSLAGGLGVLAHTRWGVNVDMTVHQGDFVGRPCRIEVHADPNNVQIGGAVSLCAEGEFIL